MVRSKVTAKLKLLPEGIFPGVRLELDDVYSGLPNVRPDNFVIAIFPTQVTFSVLELPIATDPKFSGDVQVRGIATGDPKPC